MRRYISFIFCILFALSLTSCAGTPISEKQIDEISDYVLKNADTLSPQKETEFFEYETTGLSIGGAYYGYYYSAENEIAVPDFYSDNNLGERFAADGGTYIGKPDNGTDWCFIKKITDKWYYYELHWA